jgi:polynucleotide 5'-hydroxyl-kinase GRC3/NOL9
LQTIIAKGVYSLQVLRGALHLDSAILTPAQAPLDVFAPSTHPLPILSARLAKSSKSIGTSDIPIDETLSEYPVVILLRDKTAGIEGIEGVCRLAGMPIPRQGMWGLSTGSSESLQLVSGRTFQIVSQASFITALNGIDASVLYLRQVTEPEPDLIATILPENWRLALEAVTATQSEDSPMQDGPIITLIQGSKGTGKSTFSKLLVNSLLNSG